MLGTPRTLLLIALLSCWAVLSAGAQTAFAVTPMESTHPQAQRALGFVDLAIGGRAAEAEAYLRAHGAPEWTAGAEMKTELATALERLSGTAHAVDGVDRLAPDQVAVRLKNAAGVVDTAVVVWMDSAATDRIRSVRVAMVRVE